MAGRVACVPAGGVAAGGLRARRDGPGRRQPPGRARPRRRGPGLRAARPVGRGGAPRRPPRPAHRRAGADRRRLAGARRGRRSTGATAADPQGVVRRRTISTRRDQVVGVDDELLDAEAADGLEGSVVVGDGAFLAAVSRERTGQMRDIVATIQREQDEAVRAPDDGALVVTGGPGTGKTAVALHRVAYLMYARREWYSRRGVLVVGPSPVFVDYIGAVLPALGETSVRLASLADLPDLPRGVEALGWDAPAAVAVKGSARMVQVLLRRWCARSAGARRAARPRAAALGRVGHRPRRGDRPAAQPGAPVVAQPQRRPRGLLGRPGRAVLAGLAAPARGRPHRGGRPRRLRLLAARRPGVPPGARRGVAGAAAVGAARSRCARGRLPLADLGRERPATTTRWRRCRPPGRPDAPLTAADAALLRRAARAASDPRRSRSSPRTTAGTSCPSSTRSPASRRSRPTSTAPPATAATWPRSATTAPSRTSSSTRRRTSRRCSGGCSPAAPAARPGRSSATGCSRPGPTCRRCATRSRPCSARTGCAPSS